MIQKIIPFQLSKKVRNSEIYNAAKEVSKTLLNAHFEAYIVGGCVRDFVLYPNALPKDIDIATNANIKDIQNLFPHVEFVGKNFGVCIVKYKNFSFEVATFRKDGIYIDRRRPINVSVGTLIEDSQRRDFTINALYFSMESEAIIDFHDGLKDLKRKVIRCVGKADDRMYEDALRIFRCLRFSADFKLKIEKTLLIALKKHEDGLKSIPQERLLDEISKVKNLQTFVALFYRFMDISLFFKSFIKKSQQYIREYSLSKRLLNNFKFSSKSDFFDFFILLFNYYNVRNITQLEYELKKLPCTVYDKKTCLWFVHLLQKDVEIVDPNSEVEAFEFFRKLLTIERIEQSPDERIFLILKKLISQKSFSQIITNYLKTKDSFSYKNAVETLRKTSIPENLYSSIILRDRFGDVFNR